MGKYIDLFCLPIIIIVAEVIGLFVCILLGFLHYIEDFKDYQKEVIIKTIQDATTPFHGKVSK